MVGFCRGPWQRARHRVLDACRHTQGRLRAELTQAGLAELLGKPQSYVSKVERGERLIDPMEFRQWCHNVGADPSGVFAEWDGRLR
jgi:transcriptional regulator with XRE-family HTH domain